MPHPSLLVIVYRRSAFAFADEYSSDAKRKDWLPRPQLQESVLICMSNVEVDSRPPFLSTLSVTSILWLGYITYTIQIIMHKGSRTIGHFRLLLYLCLKTSLSAKPFNMKMSSACSFIFMQIKVISIRIVSHLDSLSNRGTRELGNGLLYEDS